MCGHNLSVKIYVKYNLQYLIKKSAPIATLFIQSYTLQGRSADESTLH